MPNYHPGLNLSHQVTNIRGFNSDSLDRNLVGKRLYRLRQKQNYNGRIEVN